jgi:hypothetical protein
MKTKATYELTYWLKRKAIEASSNMDITNIFTPPILTLKAITTRERKFSILDVDQEEVRNGLIWLISG